MDILLTVPRPDNSIAEFKHFLSEYDADLYVFPEGFLDNNTLQQALGIIEERKKYVIAGFKDLHQNGLQKALVIDSGEIVGEYVKCILTKGEKKKGQRHGEKIACINTKFGKIGIPICYEIHFPEAARILCLDEPVLLVNIIGTGMYHALQLEQWTALAKARAIENEVYVIGCSHFSGEIPLAYAFAPSGQCVLFRQKEYGGFMATIDSEKSREKRINYFNDRMPVLFSHLAEQIHSRRSET